MRAVVATAYGGPEMLQLKEIAKPVPTRREVLVKIHATTVTSSDSIVLGLKVNAALQIPARLMLGITKPRKPVLGMVLAGEVESTGGDVTRYKVGDRVFAFEPFGFGAYAEYRCVPEGGVLATMPSNLTYEEAAAIPYGGMLALHFLQAAPVRAGQRVLVYGASGAVGTSAVQLARHFGADVTGVCSSANLELVRSLGAGSVIDYTKDDFTRQSQVYDVIFIAIGRRLGTPAEADCRKVLAAGGRYVSVDRGRPKLVVENLRLLKHLAEQGRLRPVIDRCYPLEQIPEAHRYVDQGHKRGNVIITVA